MTTTPSADVPERHITGMLDPFINWRCAKDNNLRCPGEGCSKADGCARDKGWTDGQSADVKALSDSAAVANLRSNQHQMDVDGIVVGVSRQALEEALSEITTLQSRLALAEAATAVVVEALRKAGEALEAGAFATFNVHRLASQDLTAADQAAFYVLNNPSTAAQALLAERDEAKAIVSDVNNSLFGSHGYFKEASGVTAADAIEKLKAYGNDQWQRAESAEQQRDALQAWVTDLQSGMYVNCVYCGHRYGPGETTPVSMADALKAHVETCPKHPMSALKAERDALQERGVRTPGTVEVCAYCESRADGLSALGQDLGGHDSWELCAQPRCPLLRPATEAGQKREGVRWHQYMTLSTRASS